MKPSSLTRILAQPTSAEKLSLYFLALLVGGLLALGILNLTRLLRPDALVTEAIPFGLTPGVRITYGEPPFRIDPKQNVPPSSLQELRRGQDLLRAGNAQAANEVFSALSMAFPQFGEALFGEALALLDLPVFEDAQLARVKQIQQKLEETGHGKAPRLLLQAGLATKQGQPQLARQSTQEAALGSPAFYEARQAYAGSLAAEGQFSRAAAEAQAAISLSLGGHPEAYAQLAEILHQSGSMDSCRQVVEYALSRFPSHVPLMLLQAVLHEYNGQFDKAERIYRKATALYPDNKDIAEALSTLGEKSPPTMGKYATGRLTPRDRAQVAIDILEPLVIAYPENLPLREALGRSYLKARQFDLARTQFSEIRDRDPEYPDIQLRLQESEAVTSSVPDESQLSEGLKRDLDSLRTVMQSKRSFEEKLGHYLVRWGASPKDFFKRYPLANFVRIDSMVWRETFYEAPLLHRYTVTFDAKGLMAIQVLVHDSTYQPDSRSTGHDLYGRLLNQNTRISGIGTSTGESDCDGKVFRAAVWESRDNFEMLAQFDDAKGQVRGLRLDRSRMIESPRLCDHVPLLLR